MLTGKMLMDDVHAYKPAAGEMAFWWIGQMGFFVKLGNATLLIDPFLSPGPGRTVPPLVAPEDLAGVDYIFGTHDHSDHIDHRSFPGMAAGCDAKFIVPEMFVKALAEEFNLPQSRFIGMDEGKVFVDEQKGLTIKAIASAHEFLDADPVTGLHPALGYIIEADGERIYHAGDSCKYDGMEGKLKQMGPFDVMYLPINGRDGKRYKMNCIGNMNFAEAVDLAGVVAPRLAVPGHYEMFAMNSENPMLFTDYMEAKYPLQEFWVGGHGVKVVVAAK